MCHWHQRQRNQWQGQETQTKLHSRGSSNFQRQQTHTNTRDDNGKRGSNQSQISHLELPITHTTGLMSSQSLPWHRRLATPINLISANYLLWISAIHHFSSTCFWMKQEVLLSFNALKLTVSTTQHEPNITIPYPSTTHSYPLPHNISPFI